MASSREHPAKAPLPEGDADHGPEWAEARDRLKKRRGIQNRIVGWIVLSVSFIAIWAASGRGYFWPGWVIGIAAVLIILRRWNRRSVTDEDIADEVRRGKSRQR